MKRIVSFALAMVLTLTVVFCAGITVSADPALTVSDECIEILKAYEGFCKYPYWDYGQWTVGYGTRCPADKLDTYKQNGITDEEAEDLLRQYVAGYEEDLLYFIKKYSLPTTQNQFDAMFLMSYNCGSGWIYKTTSNFHKIMATADADPAEVLYQFGTWSNAGNTPLVALIKRRLAEANMYLNGVYSRNRPSNYCYVIYDPAGGSLEDNVHAYNVDAGAIAPLVPTLDGYEFQGWYTDPVSGTKVTALDASTDGKTLYARWSSNGTSPELPTPGYTETTLENPVVVKVHADELNLRQGPSTQYVSLTYVIEGANLTVTATAEDSIGRLWGKTAQGWACLSYTNYEDVISGKPVEPEQPEEPPVAPSEPEVPAEPETPAEPEAPAEPEVPSEPVTPEEPEEKEPEVKPVVEENANATVVANGCLFIRKGPGTSYEKLGDYPYNSRVRILEQKSSGASMWGKTEKGWISMTYVRMDSTSSTPETKPGTTPESSTGSTTQGVTGTIKVQGSLRVRKGAGTSYDIAGYYYNGNTVTILEQVTKNGQKWGKTDLGWISMDYVVLSSGNSGNTSTGGGQTSAPEQTPSTKKTGVIKVESTLNIRNGAGTSYAIAGYYSNGAKVEILEEKQVGAVTWGRTDRGWISMAYVKVTGESKPAAVVRTVTASCLNVRADASTSSTVVGYLYRDAKVTILEQKQVGSTLWGKTSAGWIAMSYTK